VNSSSSGSPFVIKTASDPASDYSDLHHIDITAIPGAGEDISDCSFMIKTDSTGPNAPPNMQCHADSVVDPKTDADDDLSIYVTWDSTTDGAGVGVLEYAMSLENPLPTGIKTSGSQMTVTEGVNTFYVRARDKVGNWGQASQASIIIDLTDIIFTEPTPKDTIWQNSTMVQCSITIKDIGAILEH